MGRNQTDKKFVEENREEIKEASRLIGSVVQSYSDEKNISGFNLGVKVHENFKCAISTAVAYIYNLKDNPNIPFQKRPEIYGLKNLERISIVLSTLEVPKNHEVVKQLKELYPDFNYN